MNSRFKLSMNLPKSAISVALALSTSQSFSQGTSIAKGKTHSWEQDAAELPKGSHTDISPYRWVMPLHSRRSWRPYCISYGNCPDELMNLRNRIGLYGAYLLGMAGIGFTLPFLPLYLSQKGLTDAQIGWISTLAAVASLAQFPISLWADRWQCRKPFFVMALVILAIATMLLPAAQNMFSLGMLVILFAENGICRAVIESLSGAEAASLAAHDRVGAALGALRFFRPAGVVAVALAGGLWAEKHGVGSILIGVAALQSSAVVFGLLIHDRNRLAERSTRTQPAPGRAGYDRAIWTFVVAMVMFHFCNAPAGVYLGLFLMRDLHAPASVLSYAFVVSMIAWSLIARPAGRLADRIGRRPLLIVGWVAMSVRLALLGMAESSWHVLAVQVLDGVCSGLFSVLAGTWVTDRLGDARRASEAQAIVGTSLVLGSALGPAVAAPLVTLLGYRGLFGALAVVGGIATLVLIAYVPETLPLEPIAADVHRGALLRLAADPDVLATADDHD